MGLTQVSKDGVKNDAIDASKLPANSVGASELADNAVDTNAIADQAVALSKLPHGDGNSNGKFLRANNGADPSFESIPAGTTINNNADNRLITGSGSANTLNGESNLTWDGFDLDIIRGNTSMRLTCTNSAPTLNFNANNVGDAGRITLSESSGGGVMRFFTKNTGGSFAEKVRIQTEGGISFNGDTAAANALDDYEEGTFTPTFGFDNDNFNGSYSTQGGYYTKIGNVCNVSFQLVANKGTATGGTATIYNLPFNAKGVDTARSAGVVGYYEGFTVDDPIMILVEQNSNQLPLRHSNGTQSNSITTNQMSQTFRIYITITYFTN